MAHFKRITSSCAQEGKQNAVVMGRRTWESIPAARRPLPGRINVVLSSNAEFRSSLPSGVLGFESLEGAVKHLRGDAGVSASVATIFAIGGVSMFQEVLANPEAKVCCSTLHLTRVHSPAYECDVVVPDLAQVDEDTYAPVQWSERRADGDAEIQFWTYRRRTLHHLQRSSCPTLYRGPPAPWSGEHEENQYLDCIRDILATGLAREDRTGVGTISKFGVQMRFSLRSGVFPLLTTKRVFWRGVAEELLWFVSGDTSAKTLQDKNVRIWDGNATKEFLTKRGLGHYEEGDLGPVYGFQWRHFGAEYEGSRQDYSGKGVDQLAEVINTLKTNPTDRRIVLTAWNPAALDKMALPPCHMFAQFYVSYPNGAGERGELSCQMYQRSGDMGLGIPFNIASYSLLVRMIAQVCDLDAGEFVHVIGDAHVYSNHVEPLKVQLERQPKPFPTLTIDPSVRDIDGFRMEHFRIDGYDPHQAVKMEMAV